MVNKNACRYRSTLIFRRDDKALPGLEHMVANVLEEKERLRGNTVFAPGAAMKSIENLGSLQIVEQPRG